MVRINHEKRNKMDKIYGNPHPSSVSPLYKTKSSKKKRGKSMKSKYDSKCATCSLDIKKGDDIYYLFDIKRAIHKGCKNPPRS